MMQKKTGGGNIAMSGSKYNQKAKISGVQSPQKISEEIDDGKASPVK